MKTMKMDTQLRQELKLTPQLLQSIQLLQMNATELSEYLAQIMEENPALEQESDSAVETRMAELRERVGWITPSFPVHASETGILGEPGRPDREAESLGAFLRDQLGRQKISKNLLALTEYLVELIDEDGYLAQEDLDDLVNCRIPENAIQEALGILQSLEPAGVAARSLSECLLLQMSRKEGPFFHADEIISRFLPELSRKRYSAIAKKLDIPLEDVFAAEGLIKKLNPHPGRSFSVPDTAPFIIPDVYLFEEDGKWDYVLSDYYLPRVTINDDYLRLLEETEDEETRDYLRDRMQQAKWLMRSLSQRGKTLRRCVDWIFHKQQGFFTGATEELRPCGLSELAEALDLHPTTVSRAIRGKYLQCRQGVFPLNHFFPRSAAGGIARSTAKQRLFSLIQAENVSRPLSDQRLCELLAEQGIVLSRRAVTKYRMEMGIAPSSVRKKESNHLPHKASSSLI